MKNNSLFFILLCAISFSITKSSSAQFYGTNTFEYQFGNLPFEEDSDLSTSYNQLNLYYDADNISLFGKLEQFFSPIESRNYFKLTQKRIQFEEDNIRIRVGNFYETLGSGLLLRSYDIPGSVFENNFDRTRYAFFRDLEGIAVDYNTDLGEFKLIRGTTLNNALAPNFEPDSVRRPDMIEAIQANFFVSDDISAGGAFMRVNTPFTTDYDEYSSFFSTITVSDNIQVFGEYALNLESSPFALTSDESYALYAGLNYFKGSFGGSFEYKNYSNFRLNSSGFNDPPTLIKEHTYPVLNRATHVPNTDSEKGVQAELFYNFEEGHSLVANYAYTVNNVFVRRTFYEYFLEGTYKVDDSFSLKSFFDFAKDEPKFQNNRVSLGLIADKSFANSQNLIVDLQYQFFDEFGQPDKIKNYYGSVSYSFNSDFSVSTVFEATTEPGLIDDPTTFQTIETDTRFWLGFNSLYRLNTSNSVSVFAGKRRGGPACTSGICYEILDFEGVEFRITSRF